MVLRDMVLSLFLSVFLFSCSEPYLFISDSGFAELEGSGIRNFSSRPIIVEVFSEKPGPQEVLSAAREKNAQDIVFSPLYYDLAERVRQEDPGLSVHAVVPAEYQVSDGLNYVKLNTIEAAAAVMAHIHSRIPEKDPVFLTLLRFSGDARWDEMVQQLAGSQAYIQFQEIPVSVEMLKQRDFRIMAGIKTDVLLIFLGEDGTEIARKPGADSRGKMPQMIIGERFVDSDGKIESYTLTLHWSRVYRSLLDGVDEASPWILVRNIRADGQDPP